MQSADIFSRLNALLAAFVSDPDRKAGWLFWGWAGLLLLAGGGLWAFFLNWGRGPFLYHDWVEITLPRLALLQDSARQGVLPLHFSGTQALNGLTNRYLANPDSLVTPLTLLLRWLEPGPFVLVYVLLLYGVGFAGLLAFAWPRRLAALSFTALFLLFNFNGHLVAHFGVGHLTWASCFFFSWQLLLIFTLHEGRAGWGWVAQVALVNFLSLLHGGYHQVIYFFFLAVLMLVVCPRQWRWILLSGLFSGLVGAVRLLPGILVLPTVNQKLEYFAGYADLAQIAGMLVMFQVPNDWTTTSGVTSPIGTWELSAYAGLAGALFLAVFGVWAAYRERRLPGSRAALLVPAALLAMLSLDRFYKYLRVLLPFPPVIGERAPVRIFNLVFLLVLFIAAIEFQRWLDRRRAGPALYAAGAGFLVVLGHDLWQNLRLWRVVEAAERFPVQTFDPGAWAASNTPDPVYTGVLWVGLAITLLAGVGLAWMITRKG